jgi:hypothetical protein
MQTLPPIEIQELLSATAAVLQPVPILRHLCHVQQPQSHKAPQRCRAICSACLVTECTAVESMSGEACRRSAAAKTITHCHPLVVCKMWTTCWMRAAMPPRLKAALDEIAQ